MSVAVWKKQVEAKIDNEKNKMNICGVELKGNNAAVVVIQLNGEEKTVVATDCRKISLGDGDSSADVIRFKKDLEAFFKKHRIERVHIKKRAKKGKFAGGPDSFKMEGILQIIEGVETHLISPQRISAVMKKEGIEMPLSLKKYQHEAFLAAWSGSGS